jgi:sialic acid synthase SpsE
MAISIIAELCQNHLGDSELLRRMIYKAVDSGATHVKIQHIYSRNLTYRPQFENGLSDGENTISIKRPWRTEYDRLKQLELSNEQCRKFVSYVQSLGATPLTTCFSRDSIPKIQSQGFKSVKVASYDCASFQMLRELRDHFDEIIVSTGATFSNEIVFAAKILKTHPNASFLHCVTIYPTPLNEMHLSRINWLNQYMPVIGFSDHSLVNRDGILASKAAIVLGAKIIERHFTLLESDASKDGPVSIGPNHLLELSKFSSLSREEQEQQLEEEYPGWRNILLGKPDRSLSNSELLNRDYYRGRFASPRLNGNHASSLMIYNWEETPI